MTLVDTTECLNYIPAWVGIPAIIGGLFLYVLIVLALLWALKQIFKNIDDMILLAIAIFFPITLPIGGAIVILYFIVMWLIFPLIGATKEDLHQTETRLNNKIEMRVNPQSMAQILRITFNVGDFVVAKKVQTNKDGSPSNYKHIGYGATCKVLSINQDDIVTLKLVKHTNMDEQSDFIGDEFIAPARNFELQSNKTLQVKHRKVGRPRKR